MRGREENWRQDSQLPVLIRRAATPRWAASLGPGGRAGAPRQDRTAHAQWRRRVHPPHEDFLEGGPARVIAICEAAAGLLIFGAVVGKFGEAGAIDLYGPALAFPKHSTAT